MRKEVRTWMFVDRFESRCQSCSQPTYPSSLVPSLPSLLLTSSVEREGGKAIRRSRATLGDYYNTLQRVQTTSTEAASLLRQRPGGRGEFYLSGRPSVSLFRSMAAYGASMRRRRRRCQVFLAGLSRSLVRVAWYKATSSIKKVSRWL